MPEIPGYRVLSPLGSGAGGVVYRAEDTRLGRDVALKCLSHHLVQDEEARARFMHEAQILSRLDHPNVCTIFEIGATDDERLYIAMAYYAGETLQTRIRRGPLPTPEAVAIASQISAGLGRAHERGILHRDIKPANLMLTEDGVTKILDFGIAKVEDRRLTRDGAAIGTIAYMSPEQLDGAALTPATDIWSLGVVMHEMMTGRSLFGDGSEWRVMSAIVMSEHPSLEKLRPDCPPELSQLVDDCLAKRREDRIQDAGEVSARLGRIAHRMGPSPQDRSVPAHAPVVHFDLSPGPVTIVVRPFEQVGEARGTEDDHFLDGLTEEIITDLSRVRTLRVISKSSSAILKTMDRSTREVAQMLNASYVVEGGLRRQGDQLRVTARLLDGRTEQPIWAEKFSGSFGDIFDIQERVALAIFDALEVKLSPTTRAQVRTRAIQDPHAFEAYLRARQELWHMTAESFDRAEELLDRGIDIVGENPRLLTGKGLVHFQRANMGVAGMTALDRAREYGDRALALDPESPEAEYLLSLVSAASGDIIRATEHLRRAIDHDPSNSDGLATLVVLLGYLGKTATAFSLLDRLVEIDPLSPVHQGTRGWLHLVDGRTSQAVEAYRQTVAVLPDSPIYQVYLALALAHDGNRDASVATLDALQVNHGDDPAVPTARVLRAGLCRGPDELRRAITPDMVAMANNGMVASWILSAACAQAGILDDALAHLQSAIRLGFINYPFLFHLDPLLEPLRDDPRFRSLREQTKSRWEQLEIR
ncbi:MAG: protein kinase [Longimicrobiales bacterium]|nr:protein kinase [Longimicrobiales bacterium]